LHPDIFAIPGRGTFINNNPGASILGAIPTFWRVQSSTRSLAWSGVRQASNQPIPEYKSVYPMAREFFRKAYAMGLDVKFGLAAAVTQAFLMAPLSALAVVLMFYVLDTLTHSEGKAALLALLFAFATPVFYRTAQLNHNLLQSHLAFFAFVLLWRPWEHPDRPRRPSFLLAGLLAGWTVVLDYSGLIIVLALSVYALIRWISQAHHLAGCAT
jgi:predicted ABC-type exoprotein transport system permease subunit